MPIPKPLLAALILPAWVATSRLVAAGPEAAAPRAAATLAEAEEALAQLVTVRRGDGGVVARGSAFFIDAFGQLLTCAHVLDHMPKDELPRLRLQRGPLRRFAVVRVDREADLALLSSDPPDRFLALGQASLPQVGDSVLLAGFAARPDGDAAADGGAASHFKRAAVVALERRWASGARRTIGSRRRIVTVKVDQVADPGQSGGPLLAMDTLIAIGVLRANLERAPGGLGGVAEKGYGAAVPLLYVLPLVTPPN